MFLLVAAGLTLHVRRTDPKMRRTLAVLEAARLLRKAPGGAPRLLHVRSPFTLHFALGRFEERCPRVVAERALAPPSPAAFAVMRPRSARRLAQRIPAHLLLPDGLARRAGLQIVSNRVALIGTEPTSVFEDGRLRTVPPGSGRAPTPPLRLRVVATCCALCLVAVLVALVRKAQATLIAEPIHPPSPPTPPSRPR